MGRDGYCSTEYVDTYYVIAGLLAGPRFLEALGARHHNGEVSCVSCRRPAARPVDDLDPGAVAMSMPRRMSVFRVTAFAASLLFCVLSIARAAPGTAASTAAQAQDIYQQLRYRHIGPVGNRIAAVAGIAGDPHTYYAGAASGGIWKTVDGGLFWEPIFDEQIDHAIGALEVAPSDPQIIWAGTGEPHIRSNVSVGTGWYKSTDGGKNWRHMGQGVPTRTAAIVIHPTNPDIVYIAALGHAHGPRPVRNDVAQTGDGFLVLRHQKLKKDGHQAFYEISRDGVWPWFEKIGARIVGQWQIVYPDGSAPKQDYEEGYRLARYVSEEHWKQTRARANIGLGGDGPDSGKNTEALAERNKHLIHGPYFLRGHMAPGGPYFLPGGPHGARACSPPSRC